MKYLPLIFANVLRRNRFRNALCILVIALAVLLITLLLSIQDSFSNKEEHNTSFLVMRHRTSMFFSLPENYLGKVLLVPGVKDAYGQNWMGALNLANPGNAETLWASDAEKVVNNRELNLTQAQKEAFLADRTGCILGKTLAQTMGVKAGDQFKFLDVNTELTWDLKVHAVFDNGGKGFDNAEGWMHRSYYKERVGSDFTQFIYVVLEDPSQGGTVAKAIDENFKNSTTPVLTESEGSLMESVMSMIGNVQQLLFFVGFAVFLSMTMVAMSSIVMAARERTVEVGIFKSIGFKNKTILMLTVSEAVLVSIFGAILGIVLTLILGIFAKPFLQSMISGFDFKLQTFAITACMALFIGLLSGMIPAVMMSRLKTVDALRSIH